jgi:hypothetical protein
MRPVFKIIYTRLKQLTSSAVTQQSQVSDVPPLGTPLGRHTVGGTPIDGHVAAAMQRPRMGSVEYWKRLQFQTLSRVSSRRPSHAPDIEIQDIVPEVPGERIEAERETEMGIGTARARGEMLQVPICGGLLV